MNNYRKHLRAASISALGYGLGFAIGVVLIKLVLGIGFLETISDDFENQRLFAGLLILISVVILGGALAGGIGGLVLSYAVDSPDRKRTTTRSALGIGIGFGIVLLPLMLLVAMMAMYNAGDASPAGFTISIGIVGALFGLVAGLMTGTLPSKINYWRTAGIAAFSFGLGGIGFGFGLWHYFYTLYETGAAVFELLLAFFVFGGVGGFFLGWIFSLDQEKAALAGDELEEVQGNVFYRAAHWFKTTKFYQKRGFWGTVIFFALIFLLSRLLSMSPLNASTSHISDYLPSDTIGVQWSAPWKLTDKSAPVKHPSVAQAGDLVAVTWEQDGDIYFSTSTFDSDHLRVWKPAVNLSNSPGVHSSDPQIVVDADGQVHLAWVEAVVGQANSSMVLYRACLEDSCTEPAVISNISNEGCSTETNLTPAMVINGSQILLVWSNHTDNLPLATWQIGESSANAQSGCAFAEGIAGVENPRLAAHPEGGFVLAFDNGDEIFIASTDSTDNAFQVVYQEGGSIPEVFVDGHSTVHAAWCGTDGQISYREEGTLTKTIPNANCLTRPALGQNANDVIHLLWYGNQAEQPSGKLIQTNLLYESHLISGVWSDPTIVGLSAEMAQPTMATGSDKRLHLVWEEATSNAGQVNYASYRVYECSEADLNTQGQLALEVAQSGIYRPPDDVVPYCQNQFDRLLILPKADPAYSDIPPTLNGAFDQVSDLIQTAQYEVLLSTMWYETDDTNTSPGFVLAQGVKGLYDQVKANPERYPRGITVRILLDNPPEFTLSNLISQVWNVFQHLRAAGVPTMSDPDIGWNLEVANYAGSWPHGHTKMIVIDGKTAIAAGFNYQHKHQSKDHPSGKGKDDYDLGLQMTGPVAQSTQLSFDDLWYGSNRIICPDLGSDSSLWWLSCRRQFATTDHVPEVEKFYLANENHNAFALHRTQKFNESDVTVARVVSSAQETLDVLQVNFTLKLICDLNVIFRVCNFDDALSYMDAMMDAIEANQVKARVLIKPGVIEGVESNVAVEEFRRALAERGLYDMVEFRYFNDSVHAKAVLVDDQFMLVGSQNFHYSAWGQGVGLTEFNIGTDDPEAIDAFKRFFNYHWERGTPVPVK